MRRGSITVPTAMTHDLKATCLFGQCRSLCSLTCTVDGETSGRMLRRLLPLILILAPPPRFCIYLSRHRGG